MLRQAIADHQRRFYGIDLDPDCEIVVTAGATEALAGALLGMLDAGDEVIVFEPMYDSYRAGIALADARAVPVLLAPDETGSYVFDVAELRAAVGPRTKLILVNTPHNPTGKVFDRDELQVIADVAIEHDLIVVTDEVYEHLPFDGREHMSRWHVARHGRAHADHLVGRQDLPHDRLEDRLDDRPRACSSPRPNRQAVPDVRERCTVPTGDRGRVCGLPDSYFEQPSPRPADGP